MKKFIVFVIVIFVCLVVFLWNPVKREITEEKEWRVVFSGTIVDIDYVNGGFLNSPKIVFKLSDGHIYIMLCTVRLRSADITIGSSGTLYYKYWDGSYFWDRG